MGLARYLKEVEKAILDLPTSQKSSMFQGKSYIGANESSFTFLDIKIPLVRKRFKEGFSFQTLSPEEQWEIWDYVWKRSHYFEVTILACFWVETRMKIDILKHLDKIISWQKRVDNWAHSDSLSSFFSFALENEAKGMMTILKQWSSSKNPWERRQSLVSLFFYSRLRKKHVPLKVALTFIKKHLRDEHYFVQKGVGWTLREAWNVYPEATETFLFQHAYLISAAAWTAATEKLSPKNKDRLKSKRKKLGPRLQSKPGT